MRYAKVWNISRFCGFCMWFYILLWCKNTSTKSTLWKIFFSRGLFSFFFFPLTLFVLWWLFANPRFFDYYDCPVLPIDLLYLSATGFPTRFSGTGDGVVFISCLLSHRRRSKAMRDAMFLKPILVPTICKQNYI